MLLVFGVLMYVIIKMGNHSDPYFFSRVIHSDYKTILTQGFSIFTHGLQENLHTQIAMLLLQMIAILFIARLMGWLFVKMKQPSVIGEMVAGILLGPSVLAKLLPEVSAFLFSPESLDNITILSQIGLILYMFVIGMELDISEIRKKFNETLLISHTGIIVPFLCGALVAYWTYPRFASGTTPFVSYALFIGISMSITAFPVLARIIQEKGLIKSHLGVLSLASAANGDISAWCLMAVVIAIAQSGTFFGSIYTILFALLFLLVMFFVIRPFINIIGNLYKNKEVVTKTIVAFMLLILIMSAFVTEVLGVHVLFGAFMAGVIMPANFKFRKILTEKVEDLSLSIFLPLFFVSTGLKTEIGLIGSMGEWMVCLAIIGFAVVGKVFGTAFAARVTGESWKNCWSLGVLMNTRGLMELIILTIGYEMKILPPTIFVMLVLMTLATTVMTGPLLNFIDYCYPTTKKTLSRGGRSEKCRLLLSFGRASSGQVLLKVADQLFSKGDKPVEFTALHLTLGTELNPIYTEEFEEGSFGPIKETARQLRVEVRTRYDVTNDISREIMNIVNDEQYDFLLVGGGISMSALPEDIKAVKHREQYYDKYFSKIGLPQSWLYPGGLLKDKTHFFMDSVDASIGIFINRSFEKGDRVLVILEKSRDLFLLGYAINLIRSNQAVVCLRELNNGIANDEAAVREIRGILDVHPTISFISGKQLSVELFEKNNLMLVSYDTWLSCFDQEKERLQQIPSTLIIQHKLLNV
jgi:Kef-type K+ transport system membrane component KefB